jgi:hypothetical protein
MRIDLKPFLTGWVVRSLCAACLCVSTAARAQDTAAAAPLETPASPASPGVLVAPPPAPASPELARLDAANALTAQLLALEQRTQQLELERSHIRITGPRIGKIVSWVGTALILSSAFSAWGRAETVKEALDDGRDDKAYDTDGDGDVDKQDEKRSRRVARTLLGVSLLPIGAGVFSTLLERKRRREQRALGYALEDIAVKRRALLTQLGVQLNVAPGHAALRLQLAF